MVTKTIKKIEIQFTDEEREVLKNAHEILTDFMVLMEKNNCDNALISSGWEEDIIYTLPQIDLADTVITQICDVDEIC